MAHYSGSALVIQFGSTVVSGDQRTMDVAETVKIIDTTAGADSDESHIQGTKSATIDLTILSNGTAGSAIRAALKATASGTLLWGETGTATGQPKYGCVATVNDVSWSYPYDGEVEFQVSMTKNGNWLFHYEQSGSTW